MEAIPSAKSRLGCGGGMEMSWRFGMAPVALPRKPWDHSVLGWGSVLVQAASVSCLQQEGK